MQLESLNSPPIFHLPISHSLDVCLHITQIALGSGNLQCNPLSEPSNGILDNTDDIFSDGDVQSITCDTGFAPTGATSSICMADGDGISATWIPDLSSTMCGKDDVHKCQ